jgi:predicted metal-binding protein
LWILNELCLTNLASFAVSFGFSQAALFEAAALAVLPAVREMCATGRCGAYGHRWTCPPACGPLEECAARIVTYKNALLLQTTGILDDEFDAETMRTLGERQKNLFRAFQKKLRPAYPGLLGLTSGGCTFCPQCTYPDAPCRFPQDATPSMEAFGLLVSDVCGLAGLKYYYGQKTLTYTGCILLN